MAAVKNALEKTRSAAVRVVKAPARGAAWAAGTVETARQRPRYAIAVAAAVLIGLAWIAWAVYVTASNGATAGLGVLLTWPVLLGALALIVTPFVLTAMLVQRHRDSTPAIAGPPSIPDTPEATTEKAPVAEDAREDKGTAPKEDSAASSA